MMTSAIIELGMRERDCPHCGRRMVKMPPLRDHEKPLTWVLYWDCRDCPAGLPGQSYAETEYVEEPPS